MARRAAGAVLVTGLVLGLVGLVPMVTDAASGSMAEAHAAGAAASVPGQPDLPFDSSSLVLLLVAGGIGTMGLLSREPPSERGRERA